MPDNDGLETAGSAKRLGEGRDVREGDDGGVSNATADFFVSYTSADRPWAE